jgi:hypothetical protein
MKVVLIADLDQPIATRASMEIGLEKEDIAKLCDGVLVERAAWIYVLPKSNPILSTVLRKLLGADRPFVVLPIQDKADGLWVAGNLSSQIVELLGSNVLSLSTPPGKKKP